MEREEMKKGVSQRTNNFEYILEPVFLFFYLSKEVEPVLLPE